MHQYYLHLGSNRGEKKQMIEKAIEAIDTRIGKITAKSSFYETEPWGLKDQEDFLNMALCTVTDKSPEEVFTLTKDIETSIGGVKETRWGPRSIDIDILYCDDLILQTETLTIPHKELYNRNFVLIPLMEIAGDFIDPVMKISVEEIYDECKDDGEVIIYEEYKLYHIK